MNCTSLDQQLCQVALENSPLFIGVYNPNSHEFIYINQTGLAMFELENLAQANSFLLEGLRNNEGLIQWELQVAQHLQKANEFCLDDSFTSPAGAKFWGRIRVKLLTEPDTARGHWLVNLSDIQEEKHSQIKFSEGEARFEALFMHAAMGIVMMDNSSKIVLTNRFANALFGYDSGELIGMPIETLLPTALSETHRKHTEKYLHKPQIRPMGIGLDLKARKKDGTLFSVEISLSFFEQNGNQYFISFINDITYKKKIEMEMILKNQEIKKLNESLEQEVMNRTNALVETLKDLEESKQELELALSKEKELGELKSRFVAMASHEFRTPLTAILSSASLISKYPKTEDHEKREKHLHRIKSAVSNLTDILEEFLSVGKLEEGKIEAHFAEVQIPDLVNDTLADVSNLLKKNQQLRVEHTGDNELFTDKSLLRKIIINLCSNAIKFSGESSCITIRTQKLVSHFVLSVQDEGIGISDEDQKHLFDRFFRGVNVTNIQGTGLGLHIVAKYTELLGGKVSISSKLNEGTTVTVQLDLV
ncbi:MAG: PAS domain-containing sensor histidine kinase [Flectobacillus sp.]|uniref:sensor histidine kinase n=1 Tax=Flectobacillus sp. TaxID=50419 RepID=UPI003B9A45F3